MSNTRALNAINITLGQVGGVTSATVCPTPWSSTYLPVTQTQVYQPTVTYLGAATSGNVNVQSWGALFLELALTLNTLTGTNVQPYKGVEISVNYAFTATLSSITTNHNQVFTAQWFTMITPTLQPAGFQWCGLSPAVPILGDYLYTWIEIDDNLGPNSQPISATLTATQAQFVNAQVFAS